MTKKYLIKAIHPRDKGMFGGYLQLSEKVPYTQWVMTSFSATHFQSKVLARGWITRLTKLYPQYKIQLETYGI